MPKLNPFRDTESMTRASKDTSMRSAYSRFTERPNIQRHVAPQHNITAGNIDGKAMAQHELDKSKNTMAFLNTVVNVADAWSQMQKADQTAAGETAYMEYRESAAKYTANVMMTTNTFDKATGKFGWETATQDYEEFVKGEKRRIQQKYGLKDRDVLRKFDIQARQNDLSQSSSLQKFQVDKTAERTQGNWLARKAKALNIGEFADAVNWGFENGMYKSRALADAEIEVQARSFNTRNELDMIDEQNEVYTAGLLSLVNKNEARAREKYGSNLPKIRSAAIGRASQLAVSRMSSVVSVLQSREQINSYYNEQLKKTPQQLGVSNEEEKVQVLASLTRVKTAYTSGLGQARKITEKKARENFYDNKAQDILNNYRTPDVPPNIGAGARVGIPMQDATGTVDDNPYLIDPKTGEIVFDPEAIVQPYQVFTPTSHDKETIEGFDRLFQREAGIMTMDEAGNEQYEISLNNPKTQVVAKDIANASNGQIPKSLTVKAVNTMKGDDPVQAAHAASLMASIIEDDPSGRRMDQITDPKAREMVLEARRLGEDGTFSVGDMQELMQIQSRNATQVEANRNSWKEQVGDADDIEKTIPMQTLNRRFEKLKEQDDTLPPMPQALIDEHLDNSRSSYIAGSGYGNVSRSSVDGADKTFSTWSVETLYETDGEQMIPKRAWRKNSYYAAHNDPTGTSEIVKDKIITAITNASENYSYDEIAQSGAMFSTVPAGKDTWHIHGPQGVMADSTGLPIELTVDSPGTLSDAIMAKREKESETAAVKASLKKADAILEDINETEVTRFAGQVAATVGNKASTFGLKAKDAYKWLYHGLGDAMTATMGSISAPSDLSDEELDQFASQEGSLDMQSNRTYFNYDESVRKWVGTNAHNAFKNSMNQAYETGRVSSDETTALIADHLKRLQEKGLIVAQ